MDITTIKEAIRNEDMVLIYIKSKTCSVCGELLPKVKEISKTNQVKFLEFYIEDVREVGSEFNIFSAPTILLFVMGKEVFREGRFLQRGHLTHVIEKYKDLIL
jgi:thioredoxin-like negative regulator of GroEL